MTLARDRARPIQPIWIAAAAAAALLIGLGIWALLSARPESAAVSRRDIVQRIPLSGEVVAPPDEYASAMAPYPAQVAAVLTTVGANVNRGDVLVELAHPSAAAAYDQARRAVQEAETALSNARATYGSEVAAAKKQLAAAQAAEKAARAEAKAARTDVPVRVAPAEGEPGTEQEPAPPKSAEPQPVPRKSTEPQPDPRATSARIEAEHELARAEARMAAATLPYRQQLQAAREALQDAQSGRKQAMIRAPITGTVLALNAQPGSEVGKDNKKPVATIVDLDALQALAEVRQEHAGEIREGMPVLLTFEALPGEQFEGRVDAITTTPPRPLKGAGRVAVVPVTNRGGMVKPEMKALLAVETGRVEDVLAVPAAAVRTDRTGKPIVRVLRGGNWTDQVVETGLTDGSYTEIRSGLKEDELVQVKRGPF